MERHRERVVRQRDLGEERERKIAEREREQARRAREIARSASEVREKRYSGIDLRRDRRCEDCDD